MRNKKSNLPTITYLAAFLLGAILFWSIAENWLNLESRPVFLAGLIGVAVSVVLFGAGNIIRNSKNKDQCNLTQSNNATPLPEYKTACGGKLKDPTNYPSTMYRGKPLYFCTCACLRVFERDPDPFMAGEIEHPTHEEEESK